MQYKQITNKEYYNLASKCGNYRVVNWDETEYWYQNGKLHRLDGPAFIYDSEDPGWFIKGEEYSKEEWFSLLTEDQLAIALSNPENF